MNEKQLEVIVDRAKVRLQCVSSWFNVWSSVAEKKLTSNRSNEALRRCVISFSRAV